MNIEWAASILGSIWGSAPHERGSNPRRSTLSYYENSGDAGLPVRTLHPRLPGSTPESSTRDYNILDTCQVGILK